MSLEADIRDIVSRIWLTLLDPELVAAEAADLGRTSAITSFVHLDGAWRGVVMVQCPVGLAMELTTSMFSTYADDALVGEAEVRDALGEIANMVAGNIKALLPQPCFISLPAVAIGADDAVTVPGTAATATVAFTCVGQPFVVSLLQASDGVAAA